MMNWPLAGKVFHHAVDSEQSFDLTLLFEVKK